jgi:hypothetical protein
VPDSSHAADGVSFSDHLSHSDYMMIDNLDDLAIPLSNVEVPPSAGVSDVPSSSSSTTTQGISVTLMLSLCFSSYLASFL